MKNTCTFKSKHLNEVHKINKKYNCNSKIEVNVVSNKLPVQKQSFDLWQITLRVWRECL